MKNSFLITMIAFASVGIISCTKTKINDGVNPVYPPIEESRTVSSGWISMSFSEMTNEDGTTYLQAEERLEGISNADHSTHIDFGYAKFEDAGAISYQRIPFSIANDNEDFSVDYYLENGILTVRIENHSTTGQTLSADRFQNVQFQLLMVSSADYSTMQCDWNDYSSVESALILLQQPRAELRTSRGSN